MPGSGRTIVAVALIAIAAAALIFSSTSSTAQYYLTVEELQEMGPRAEGRRVTVSGAVVGDSIVYDASAPLVTFQIVQVPADAKEVERAGGIEAVLHRAANDPALPRLDVLYPRVKPDMLRHEAQAIVRGRLDEEGRLRADEVLLKCPSRYSESVPDQAE